MTLVHFLGEEIEEHMHGYREQIESFSAGVSITYIFLQLLPELNKIATETSELIFVSPLMGFSSIHILEKYVSKADIPQKEVRKDYSEIHFSFLLLYHAAVGYLVASLVNQDAISGILFLIPVLLHLAVSSLSVTELHQKFAERVSVKVLTSTAPVIGVILYELNVLGAMQFNILFGTVIGMFFYIVIRDSIPRDSQGRPTEYILGMALYLAVILLANTF